MDVICDKNEEDSEDEWLNLGVRQSVDIEVLLTGDSHCRDSGGLPGT